ncbi:MAG: aminotransferase class III-fold pyridoxal phosphate-dependent enzyme [Candidatus Marinimicrobia bacterium]|jgi:beta-alanine--pyruvate transaminase|nr:aminotransferase class III-fold pyridoxal phosphate-dependent enzyme [Candidatus Neomarinimicrobiota bacterium]
MTSTTNLEHLWLPFSANRDFKSAPRLMNEAKGMYYKKPDGTDVLDGTAGLWCCNAGHGHPTIVKAIQDQAEKMDFAPSFQMGHPLGFAAAQKLLELAPSDEFQYVFFTNSGSESVDTVMKIVMAYQQHIGNTEKTMIIGRERAYHGVGFGGITVGGLPLNKQHYTLLPDVDHVCHTHNLEHNAFSKGQPEWGEHLADDLLRVIEKHGAEKIAAFITEPVAGSTGVLVPPLGYLKRIREICDKNDILLIFDEVITGFGRLGMPFAAQYFDVIPDMITCAKGLTSGTVPMGAVMIQKNIYEAFQHGDLKTIDLFHGYTYSAHPLAATAAIATLNVYQQDGLFNNANNLENYWAEAMHSLKDVGAIIDIRNIGLMAGIEMESKDGKIGSRGYDVFTDAFHNYNLLIRITSDTIALSPPLIVEKEHIDQIVDTLKKIILNH